MATLPNNDVTVCVKPQGRPCWVYEITAGGARIPGRPKKKALLHVITTRAYVVDASPLRGGHPGGQISIPVAVVEYEDGQLAKVELEAVQLLDTKAEMHEQAAAWVPGGLNCTTCRHTSQSYEERPCKDCDAFSNWEPKE